MKYEVLFRRATGDYAVIAWDFSDHDSEWTVYIEGVDKEQAHEIATAMTAQDNARYDSMAGL